MSKERCTIWAYWRKSWEHHCCGWLLVACTADAADGNKLCNMLEPKWGKPAHLEINAGPQYDDEHIVGLELERDSAGHPHKDLVKDARDLANRFGIALIEPSRAGDHDRAQSKREVPDETGYVESPADPAAYAPAAEIVANHTPPDVSISMKELGTIVEDYDTNHVRWTRPVGKGGQPMKSRRSVHLGDWAKYLARRTGTDADGFPRSSGAEIARRTAAVRNAKQARK